MKRKSTANLLSVQSTFRAAILCGLVLLLSGCRSLPEGVPGPEAEALADRMLLAINHEAWLRNTAAVSWDFRGKRRLLWDRKRDLVEVRWEDREVRFDKKTMRAVFRKAGADVTDPEERKKMLAAASRSFVNDAYWLNPLFHIRSPGAQRSLVEAGVLKVHFPSGGVTPGDSYVFFTDKDALVTRMRLWVSSIPIPGAEAVFLRYGTSETGVKSARLYNYLAEIEIRDLKMYGEFPPAGAADPFADIGQP